MTSNHFIGAILLIAGTSIGAGTLALPVITAQYGFLTACLLFLGCWFFMSLAALMMLEVNLSLPTDSHLVSMAKARLGSTGAVVTWLVYLLLLYALMVAYTEGMSDLLIAISQRLLGLSIPLWSVVVSLLGVFGIIIYSGTQCADWLNRGLMLGLIITFCFFIYILFPHVNPKHWVHHQFKMAWQPLPVLITAFGYQVIIPSLRNYLHSHPRRLHWAIIIGGLIPLVIYSLWQLLILGAVPKEGPFGLLAIQHSAYVVPQLTQALHIIAGNKALSLIIHLMLFFIIGTSLLGVALALFDFLLDTPIKRYAKARSLTFGLTFIPPGIIALFLPGKFVTILSYGGILVAILLIALPALMVLRQRYYPLTTNTGKEIPSNYRAPGGALGVLAPLIFALSIIGIKAF